MTRSALGTMKAHLRCAIYTRKSKDEGLDQDFNSLDAQREAGEAFVASQRHEGWMLVAERYDDGGYTGANTERPALKRLLADIEAGKVDVVVVYKIDRLTRSLFDFADIAQLFERKGVTFVAVTQPFNTATSIGRLMLHILLSFAQFEREMISERTRDKMSAARRKGKWIGGRPPLGFDIIDRRLVPNADERVQVRALFDCYLAERSLLRVAEEFNGRGVKMKSWTSSKGESFGGGLWDKAAVLRVLTNAVYIGKIEYDGKLYPGEHPAIVDEEVFKRVQDILAIRKQERSGDARNVHGFLLRGLIRCRACESVMTSSCTSRGETTYRYYTCTLVARRGRGKCPVRSVPAEAIERFVVERIRGLGTSPVLIDEVVAEVGRTTTAAATAALAQEERRLAVEYGQLRAESRQLLGVLADQKGSEGQFVRERLGEIDGRGAEIQTRLTDIREAIAAAERALFTRADITAALAMFVPVWEALSTNEQTRILRLLIDGIDYDGVGGQLEIHFKPVGIKLLAHEAGAPTAVAS